MAERYRRGFFFVIRKNCEIIIAHSQNWQGILRPKCTFRADSCAVFAIIKCFWLVCGVGTECAILYGMSNEPTTNGAETMTKATQAKIDRIEATLNKIDGAIYAIRNNTTKWADDRREKLEARHIKAIEKWEELDPTETDFCYC